MISINSVFTVMTHSWYQVLSQYSYSPFCNNKGCLTKEVAFLEGDNLVVFYYHVASEIWPDKKGTTALHEQCLQFY
jgi:hypothetical protein